MGASRWTPESLAVLALVGLSAIGAHAGAEQRDRPPDRVPPPGTERLATPRSAYDRGYGDGQAHGERDGRGGRVFSFDRIAAYQAGDRGYGAAFGSREAYRTEFRRGFAAGYRAGYDRHRGTWDRGADRLDRRVLRVYQEPAAARGYSDGYDKGLDDGRDRDRYDPVSHKDYRNGEVGYDTDYGTRDAYRNNYRAGFRQGYEDGYRHGTRR
jgi:hypothetical protein